MQVSEFVEGTIRYYFLALPLLMTVALSALMTTRRTDVTRWILVSSLLFVALILMGKFKLTFTIIFSTVVAVLLVYTHTHWKVVVRGLPIGKLLGLFAIILTIYVVMSTGERGGVGYGVRGVGQIESLGDILPALEFKAFGDRGILWAGAWDTLVRENNIWPPIQPPLLNYVMSTGHELEVTFGAHNIGLELLRQYGFVVGFIGILVYLTMIGYVGRVFVLRPKYRLMMIVGAEVLATALVGGLVGQYVLMNNFSFLLTGLAGLVYGYVSGTSMDNEVECRYASHL